MSYRLKEAGDCDFTARYSPFEDFTTNVETGAKRTVSSCVTKGMTLGEAEITVCVTLKPRK